MSDRSIIIMPAKTYNKKLDNAQKLDYAIHNLAEAVTQSTKIP